ETAAHAHEAEKQPAQRRADHLGQVHAGGVEGHAGLQLVRRHEQRDERVARGQVERVDDAEEQRQEDDLRVVDTPRGDEEQKDDRSAEQEREVAMAQDRETARARERQVPPFWSSVTWARDRATRARTILQSG